MFLMRDEKMGTRAVQSVPPTAFPWAVNSMGQVVYIDCKDDPTAPRTPVSAPLSPYSKTISMDRRRKCQSKLADIALKTRSYTSGAVNKVSLEVINYIQNSIRQNKPIQAEIEACMAKYMYSNAGYGRLGQPADKPTGQGDLYRLCLTTLTQGELPSILAIHDFMGRIVFKKFGGTIGQGALFDQTGNAVRPAYIFGDPSKDSSAKIEELRGRTARPGNPPPTTAPGMLSEKEGKEGGYGDYQKRERGSDKWMATTEKTPPSTLDIQQRNLIFGAGPSGSTGTLLQAGKLFGNLDGDLLRQYVLAIVAYLVGGGMHSYHEVMVIARMAGCPYKDGAYVPSLPDGFLRSLDFEEWCADYFDIVVLGARLWILTDSLNVGRLNTDRVAQFDNLFSQMPKKTGQLDPARVANVGKLVEESWKIK
jgi:hypothetical protein